MDSRRIVIVGGAIMGSFCAWSLREAGFTGPVTVVERDSTYRYSSTALSAAGIRTQFGTPVSIKMSLFAADMFRHIKDTFGEDADVGYREAGYLILGRPEEAVLRAQAAAMQCAQGADVVVLDRGELEQRYPGVSFEGIGVGTLGVQHEGWFDAWSLLSTVRRSARARGVAYVDAAVQAIEADDGKVTGVRLSNGETLACDVCVVAAGALSGRLVAPLGIALPVVPKKRTVFAFKAPFKLPNFPMLFDSSGIWVRPEGDGYIGGIQPPAEADRDADGDFEPHHELLQEVFWPALAARIPAMQALRLNRAWAGHYEMNTLDHNGVVGPHDELANLIFATGFSGHGVMHAPAVGRGVAELITTGGFRSVDLSCLGWARIRSATPLFEPIVY